MYTLMPFSVVWYLTNTCNLNCPFCFQNHNKQSFTFLECLKILEKINKLSPFSISLIGGEIFLLDYILDLIKEINKKNIVCNLATNGTLLNVNIVKKLAKYKIGYVQLSLDGLEKTHDNLRGQGNYNVIINSIKMLKKEGIKVHVDPLLTKKNKNEIQEIIKKLEELDVDLIKFNLFFPVGKGEKNKEDFELSVEEIKDIIYQIKNYKGNIELRLPIENWAYEKDENMLEKKLNSYSCVAGQRKVVILSNGNIVACEFFKDEVIGNVYKDDLYDLWVDSNNFKRWRENIILDTLCHTCKYLEACKGGCRFLTVIKENNFNGKFYNCLEAESEKNFIS